MPDEIAKTDSAELTDGQRQKFLAVLNADKFMGNVAALRAAGVEGTKRDLRAMLTDELLEQARTARGWSLEKVENCTWEVATNPEHPAWDRANARVLKAYHPAYQDHSRIEHTGPGGQPIQVEDRSASLADVARVLEAVGALAELSGGTPRRALPTAQDILAEPPQR